MRDSPFIFRTIIWEMTLFMEKKISGRLKKIYHGLRNIIIAIVVGFLYTFHILFRRGPFVYPLYSKDTTWERLKNSIIFFQREEDENAKELYEFELEQEKEKQKICRKNPMLEYCNEYDGPYFGY